VIAHLSRRVCWSLVGVCAACLPQFASAQPALNRGFDQPAPAFASGEERNRQRDLWVLEVHFKSMRMIWVDITDPATGEQSREQIWYLPFKAVNRPITSQQASDRQPVNQLDPVPERPKFIPEFTLVTYDNPANEIPSQIYMDDVLPEAVATVNVIEARRDIDPLLKDTVSIIRDLPDAAAEEERNPDWLYGVATWRGVDPETDFFKVILTGFSNGYEIKPGPGGEDVTWRKVLVQRFSRLGDRFDPDQIEFKFIGDPQWEYQPDAPAAPATAEAATTRR